MNLILLQETDFTESKVVRLKDRSFKHIKEILRSKKGDTLCVGLQADKVGQAKILSITDKSVDMEVEFNQDPPKAIPGTCILALPRPIVLSRILMSLSLMGVKKIYLIQSFRVEKSYWSSPNLKENNIREQLILGLEQSKDTILPEVYLRKKFKPFVEDELLEISKNTLCILAHPESDQAMPSGIQQSTTLIIGPEGGFVDFEVTQFKKCGFKSYHLGPRILKVETALPVILGKLFF